MLLGIRYDNLLNTVTFYAPEGMWLLFMPPIIKCPVHYVMAYASVSVNIWFPSIIGQTPGSIDPIFLWLIGDD
jgi:hypothetical protein